MFKLRYQLIKKFLRICHNIICNLQTGFHLIFLTVIYAAEETESTEEICGTFTQKIPSMSKVPGKIEIELISV